MATVLIVDDEADLAGILDFNLRQAGLQTRVVHSGEDALALARIQPPDLILLDVMLPGLSGMEVCRQLKQHPSLRAIPIIMLTARSDEIDRVVGFELGADDYVVKPFSVRELVLRVLALLRRAKPAAPDPGPARSGPVEIDRAAHRVLLAGAELELTPIEFKLLVTLIERAGRVQTREVLLADVWGLRDVELETRTIDTHMKRLREKLGEHASLLETVRGVGYRFRTDA